MRWNAPKCGQNDDRHGDFDHSRDPPFQFYSLGGSLPRNSSDGWDECFLSFSTKFLRLLKDKWANEHDSVLISLYTACNSWCLWSVFTALSWTLTAWFIIDPLCIMTIIRTGCLPQAEISGYDWNFFFCDHFLASGKIFYSWLTYPTKKHEWYLKNVKVFHFLGDFFFPDF